MLNKPNTHRINRYRSLFFQIGLVMATGFCLMAFEVKSPNEFVFPEPVHTTKIQEPPIISLVWVTEKKAIATKAPPHPNPTPTPISTEPDPIPIPEPRSEPIVLAGSNLLVKQPPAVIPTPKLPKALMRAPTYLIPEIMPEFPGGVNALMAFLSTTKYCQIEKKNNIEGTVFVSFVVNEYGEAVDVKVLRGVSNCLNQQAVNKIKSMPKWTPGQQGEQLVRVPMTVQFAFQLE